MKRAFKSATRHIELIWIAVFFIVFGLSSLLRVFAFIKEYILLTSPIIILMIGAMFSAFFNRWKSLNAINRNKILDNNDLKLRKLVIFFFLAFLFWALLGCFRNIDQSYLIIGYVFSYFILIISLIIAKPDSWPVMSLKAGFFFSLIFTVIALITWIEQGASGRMTALLRPASQAMIASCIIFCGLAINSFSWRFIGIILAVFTVILCDSRTALLALIAACTTIIIIKMKVQGRRKYFALKLFAISFAIVLCIVLLFWSESYHYISDWVANVLSWHDPHRGIQSGFSHRTLIFKEAYELFLTRPILGWGFRISEKLLITSSSAHNGYLQTLVDVGLPGFLFALFCYLLITVRIYKRYQKYGNNIDLAFLAILIFNAFFSIGERYLFNVGNILSILVIAAICLPTAHKQK